MTLIQVRFKVRLNLRKVVNIMKNRIYKRKVFDEIIQYLQEDVILVINGARQVGKTYILFYLEKYLKKKIRFHIIWI